MWLVLGVASIAALSIFGGMPIARSRRLSEHTRSVLTAAAVGILLYLFYDLFASAHDLAVSFLPNVGATASVALEFAGGAAVGGLALPASIEWVACRRARSSARSTTALASAPPVPSPALAPIQVSTLTALAIGVHNFSEGLVVGIAIASGLVGLSLLLCVGVIAHKSAEGYCICGCAPGASQEFSTRQLVVLGAIGGGPVVAGALLGTVVGGSVSVLVAAYGLAVGAILSVIIQMLGTGLLRIPRSVLVGGILLGLFCAFGSDVTLAVAGL
ncbi:MAG TPA: hypothetical protein VFG07_09765 [Thermoplasmata archaeon]|nr:hypothetical protein [Thermoplasmata archaeon]